MTKEHAIQFQKEDFAKGLFRTIAFDHTNGEYYFVVASRLDALRDIARNMGGPLRYAPTLVTTQPTNNVIQVDFRARKRPTSA